MIVVTGTKRSGTSMWMQVLRAAGLPVFGAEFPKDWGEVIRAANPAGFFESHFRNGINFTTNPNPRTGEYIHPEQVGGHVVKVFVPGLMRTDLAFVEAVVGTMRDWREYAHSLDRLYAMEADNRERPEWMPEMVHPPPVLEWWSENYSLVADHVMRRYPLHLVAYDETLEAPERVIRETIGWLGVGDADAAVAAVEASHRTQRDAATPEGVAPQHAEVFDALYAHVRERRSWSPEFIRTLNEVNDALAPAINDAMEAVRAAQRARREAVAKHSPDGSAEAG